MKNDRQNTNYQYISTVIPKGPQLWSLIDWVQFVNDSPLHPENIMYHYEFNPFYNQYN